MSLLNNKLEIRKKTILALSYAKEIGYSTIRRLYMQNKRLEEIKDYNLKELINLFKQCKIKSHEDKVYNFFNNKQKLFEKAEIDYTLSFKKRNIHLILDTEIDFPRLLQYIPDKPFWLFVEGNIDVLKYENKVAVVGTRHPTIDGIKIAEKLTKYLVENDYIIVSGLAKGIDEAAHKNTNKLKGKGIAILGCGINKAFPAKTINIRKSLAFNGGAIISEYMINDSYSKQKFIWRNRLISGISKIVFPIQGTLHSGTFHIIRFAEQQNRKIIGIFMNEIKDIYQNEILKYFKEKKFPIYDIAKDKDKIINSIEDNNEFKEDIKQPSLF